MEHDILWFDEITTNMRSLADPRHYKITQTQ